MKFPTLSHRDQRTLAVILLVCLPLLSWSVFGTFPFVEGVDCPYQFQVDLDDATTVELRLLPGIGEKLANAIVLDRAHCGSFRDPTDLRRVKGIGSKKLEAVRSFLRHSPIPNTE